MSDPRFAERRRQNRRRWWWRIAVLLVVGAVMGGLVWAVGYSTLLAVRQVEVVGLNHADEGEIRAAAAIPMGRPLVRVDTDGAAARVEEIARVESAQVKRSWPRTMRIEVTERVAVGYLSSGSGFTVFDRHGVEFAETETAPESHVEVRYSGPPEDRPEVLSEAAAVIAAVREDAGDLAEEIEVVEVASRDTIEFVLSDDVRVRWGSAERIAEKIEVLAVLRQQPARIYDVAAPHQPTTTS